MKLKLEETAMAMDASGDLHGLQERMVTRVQTDSRMVSPGDLFFCLQGLRFDGHSFAREAVLRKAAAVVAHKPLPELRNVPVLTVDNTLRALGRLGRYWRQKAGRRVIGITGSAGKTTTKEILSGVLGAGFKVGKNYQNWNNQVGLPLSLLGFTGREDFWILELGINSHADMDDLGEILLPDAAVILNVGPCHLQELGDIDGVAAAKARILDYLRPEHKALLNMDYPWLQKEALSRPHTNIIWFSAENPQAAYRVRPSAKGEYILYARDTRYRFRTPFQLGHLCENLAAVLALALEYGMSPQNVQKGLDETSLPQQRMSITSKGPWTLIDDTYNANPMSMQAALEAAENLASGQDIFLVLGDMAELGRTEKEAHRELGRSLKRIGFTALFYCGHNLQEVQKGLNSDLQDRVHPVEDISAFLSAWKKLGPSGGTILFKGSRKIGMEKFLQAFHAGCLR